MNLNVVKGNKGLTPKGNLGDSQHDGFNPFLFIYLFGDTSIPHYTKYNIYLLIIFNVVTTLPCSTLISYFLTISVRRYHARRCARILLLSL